MEQPGKNSAKKGNDDEQRIENGLELAQLVFGESVGDRLR